MTNDIQRCKVEKKGKIKEKGEKAKMIVEKQVEILNKLKTRLKEETGEVLEKLESIEKGLYEELEEIEKRTKELEKRVKELSIVKVFLERELREKKETSIDMLELEIEKAVIENTVEEAELRLRREILEVRVLMGEVERRVKEIHKVERELLERGKKEELEEVREETEEEKELASCIIEFLGVEETEVEEMIRRIVTEELGMTEEEYKDIKDIEKLKNITLKIAEGLGINIVELERVFKSRKENRVIERAKELDIFF